ncbi:MAG: hypothetical protein FWF04_04950, partial [Clostridiales bacterium]|nr:hypothetical protein [Clostridiales bacterium]
GNLFSYTGNDSGLPDTLKFSYVLADENIGAGMTYTFAYIEYDLSLDFTLISCDSYDTLEDIGITAYHNDISITAVPMFLNGQMQVELYILNNSEYLIHPSSFSKYLKFSQKAPLSLETNSGVKSYTDISGREHYDYRSGFNRNDYRGFLFDIEPDDSDFTVRIPYILVHSPEEAEVTLPLPREEGEKVAVDKKAAFKDCLVTFSEVERMPPDEYSIYGGLKITLAYENKTDNKIMMWPELSRLQDEGENSYSENSYSMEDTVKDGIYDTVYYNLLEGERDELRLKIYDPVYYLTDEYAFSFSRQ